LLFLADYPVQWPWLQLVAFVPLLLAVPGARSALAAGAYGISWTLGRVIPLGFMVDSFHLPWWARMAVLLYLIGLDLVFALLVFRARALRSWLFALVVAIAFAAIEAADSRLPLWGTARTMARAWSIFPRACGLVSRSGDTFAVAFVVVCAQALVVMGVRRRERWSLLLAALVVAAGGLLSFAPRLLATETLRIAAVGWGPTSDAPNIGARIRDAVAAGARLVVFPEVAFEVSPGARQPTEAYWSRLAREGGIWLVIPFWDQDRPGNRVAVFDPRGQKRGEYTKHHLVPLAESFPPGDGAPLIFDVDGVSVGVAICQDDNFRDVARLYARRGAQVLVVPTLEGPPAVGPYHLRNSLLRTIENPMALVRATAQGQSAAIAPGGEIVALFDHAQRGAGVLVANVPVAKPSSR
jgi:apolipoprotein N-acyltransferase